MADIQGGRIVVTVEGKDVGLADLLKKVETGMTQTAIQTKYFGATMKELDPIQKSVESSSAAFASSLANNAVASKDYNSAISILANTLQTELTPGTVAYNRVATQLQTVINRQTDEIKAQGSPITNLAGGLNKLVGAYFAVTQGVQLFLQAIESGNQLEKTEATFRALSGSQENYERNLGIARSQQEKFGGSLQDNIEGLSGFANLSQRTGIQLESLANIARRLAIIDPAQGFKGASIALKEFFSGDTTSLARRFEINKSDLNSIKQLGSDAEKLQALDGVLEKLGISQELLTAQTETTAVAYDKLKGSAADAGAVIGQILAKSMQGVAELATQYFNIVANGLPVLTNQSAQVAMVSGTLLTTSKSYDEFNAAVKRANDGINQQAGILAPFVEKIKTLTPAEYEFVQALMARGVAADSAVEKLQKLNDVSSQYRFMQEGIAQVSGATNEQINQFGAAILLAASSGDKGREVANGYTSAVLDQALSIDEAIKYLGTYNDVQFQQANAVATTGEATTSATFALNNYTEAVRENAAAQMQDTVESMALSAAQEQLTSIANGAANGLISVGQAADAMAAQFGIARNEALNLISALQEINNTKARTQLGISQYDDATQRAILGGRSPQSVQQSTQEADKLVKSYKNYLTATSTTAENLARAKAELNGIRQGTAEWYDQQVRVNKLQEQYDNEQKKGRKSGAAKSPKLTQEEKTNNSILKAQDSFQSKYEDAERDHYDKLAKIQADYNEKVLKQQAANETGKRRSRAGFYTDIGGMEGIDSDKFAAQYEQAFAEAQKLAQDGKARLSQEFLELRQKQIEEMAQLDEEAAKVNSDSKLSKKEKQRQLEYIEGRRKLVADAQAEEQKQLIDGGDSLQNERDKQLADEAKAYSDNVDQISIQAGRKADAIVTQAEREKKAVTDANLELANQLKTTKDIAAAADGIAPKTTTTVDSTVNTNQSVSVDNPVALDNATAMLVQQQSIWLVRDDGVISSINDSTARLESKLTDILNAVNESKTSVTGAIGELKGAINNMKTVNVVTSG